MSLNTWYGMGRITKDLEKKVTPSGVSVMNFTIAVDDDYKPKDGSDPRVAFVDCVAWRHTADYLEKYFSKGRKIVVVGSWWPEKWIDKDGKNRISWKVQVDDIYPADSRPKGDQQGGDYSYSASGTGTEQNSFSPLKDADGNLPF